MTTLAVAEIFRAHQGEGPSAGRAATFLRLGGCNLSCRACDTPYTWDATRYDLRAEITTMDVEDVATKIAGTDLLVITGGEPLLQSRAIDTLLDAGQICRDVEIETNGTLPPPIWADRETFNVSPKLASFGQPSALHESWLAHPSARFKFVVTGPDDLEQVAAYGTAAERTWVMPEGTTAERILEVACAVSDDVLARGWNLTLRQHVLLYGAERGR